MSPMSSIMIQYGLIGIRQREVNIIPLRLLNIMCLQIPLNVWEILYTIVYIFGRILYFQLVLIRKYAREKRLLFLLIPGILHMNGPQEVRKKWRVLKQKDMFI